MLFPLIEVLRWNTRGFKSQILFNFLQSCKELTLGQNLNHIEGAGWTRLAFTEQWKSKPRARGGPKRGCGGVTPPPLYEEATGNFLACRKQLA